jgi:hypothetical protein
MEMTIVKPKVSWPAVALREPLPYGYIYVGAVVEPRDGGGPPFPPRSARRAALLERLTVLAVEVRRLEPVARATVYRAVLMPPIGPVQFDVAVLIETRSVNDLPEVMAAEPCRRLLDVLREAARSIHVMEARCGRLIADVDKSKQGTFLFNHFTSDDPQVALELWDLLAAWYAAKTGLDNSTLLQPIGTADFAFVNHARWDQGLLRLAVEQFARPSFWTYVRANLRANNTVAMPVLFRLA